MHCGKQMVFSLYNIRKLKGLILYDKYTLKVICISNLMLSPSLYHMKFLVALRLCAIEVFLAVSPNLRKYCQMCIFILSSESKLVYNDPVLVILISTNLKVQFRLQTYYRLHLMFNSPDSKKLSPESTFSQSVE